MASSRGFKRPNGEPSLSNYIEWLIERDTSSAITEAGIIGSLRAEIDRLQVIAARMEGGDS